MKVSELITELQKYDPNYDVYTHELDGVTQVIEEINDVVFSITKNSVVLTAQTYDSLLWSANAEKRHPEYWGTFNSDMDWYKR